MRIMITNKIEEKVNEYQKQTGATKTWIADKIGISKSRLYQICQADNMMLDVAMRFALFFDCPIDELFDYSIINEYENNMDK